MDDDFNTAFAIGLIYDLVREVNKFLAEVDKKNEDACCGASVRRESLLRECQQDAGHLPARARGVVQGRQACGQQGNPVCGAHRGTDPPPERSAGPARTGPKRTAYGRCWTMAVWSCSTGPMERSGSRNRFRAEVAAFSPTLLLAAAPWENSCAERQNIRDQSGHGSAPVRQAGTAAARRRPPEA